MKKAVDSKITAYCLLPTAYCLCRLPPAAATLLFAVHRLADARPLLSAVRLLA
jgi:hypothetical protein